MAVSSRLSWAQNRHAHQVATAITDPTRAFLKISGARRNHEGSSITENMPSMPRIETDFSRSVLHTRCLSRVSPNSAWPENASWSIPVREHDRAHESRLGEERQRGAEAVDCELVLRPRVVEERVKQVVGDGAEAAKQEHDHHARWHIPMNTRAPSL